MRLSKYAKVDAKIKATTSAVAIYARALHYGGIYLASDVPIHAMTAISKQVIHICSTSNIRKDVAASIVEFANEQGVTISFHENMAEELEKDLGPHYRWESSSNCWVKGTYAQ